MVPVIGSSPGQLSTIAVEKSVDDLREYGPSAESAEEFYELTRKSPLRKITI
jgi:biotin operon repressor